MTVISPATATERLLIAPSISPISRAFVVPIAWDAVPIARPFATGSFILKIFKKAEYEYNQQRNQTDCNKLGMSYSYIVCTRIRKYNHTEKTPEIIQLEFLF